MTAERTHAERAAHEHEHARVHEAAETLAQRLEIAGHDREAALVRAIRRRMAEDIARQSCERPDELSEAEGDALTRQALQADEDVVALDPPFRARARR